MDPSNTVAMHLSAKKNKWFIICPCGIYHLRLRMFSLYEVCTVVIHTVLWYLARGGKEVATQPKPPRIYFWLHLTQNRSPTHLSATASRKLEKNSLFRSSMKGREREVSIRTDS